MADNKVNVKRNIAYDTFYRILTTITPFITAPYIARVIGAEGIGIQSYTQAIQSYFIMFASLGTSYYGAREIAYHRDEEDVRSRIFWEIELLAVITTAVCFLLWVPLVITSSEYGRFYLVLSLGVIGTALDISWFYTGLEKFRSIVIRNTVVKIVEVVLLFTLVKGPDDLIIYVAIGAVTSFLCIISYWVGLGKLVKKVPLRELRLRRHLKGTMIFFLPSVASSIYLMLDKPLITWITGDNAEVGYYQQAHKFIEVVKSLVFVSINYVVGVRMSSLYAHGEYDEMKKQFNNSMNYILLMGFGCSFGLSAVASKLVPVFYGSGYERVVPLIYIFSPIVVIIGVSNCLETQYFTPCGRRAESLKYLVAGACVNFILNLLLIPSLKAFGAALATVAAELVITILYIVNSRKMISFSAILKMAWKKLLSGIVMFLVVVQLERTGLNDILLLALEICSGVVVYFLLLVLLRDEWTLKFIRNTAGELFHRKKA
jgi:O-antigen/teichoic acid export membrane protein